MADEQDITDQEEDVHEEDDDWELASNLYSEIFSMLVQRLRTYVQEPQEKGLI